MSEIIQRYRFLDKYLPKPSSKRLVVLTGARQTGKTTLSKSKYPGLNYINLDSPENRETLKKLSTASWAGTIGPAIIDESQKEPIIFDKVKYAFDNGSVPFTVLTGSSQILLLKNIRESLAGRAFFYELWPLMQSEINLPVNAKEFREPLLFEIISKKKLSSALAEMKLVFLDEQDAPYRLAEDYILKWGGMPALLPLTDKERAEWLKNYGYTFLERDLSDLARLDDLSPFRAFQKLSALRSGMLLNYSELARDAGISVDTARRYMEYLRLSYQAFLLQPYHRNVTSSTIKTPKIYFTDVGILRRLTGYRGDMTGELFETMVVSELIKGLKTFQKNFEIYFYRTRSGMELDILLKTEYGLIGMEIKSRQTIAKKDISAMKEIAAGLGTEWIGGIVVYRGNEIKKIAEPDIWAIPSRRLFQSPVPSLKV
jgi:uncharacterized protein